MKVKFIPFSWPVCNSYSISSHHIAYIKPQPAGQDVNFVGYHFSSFLQLKDVWCDVEETSFLRDDLAIANYPLFTGPQAARDFNPVIIYYQYKLFHVTLTFGRLTMRSAISGDSQSGMPSFKPA